MNMIDYFLIFIALGSIPNCHRISLFSSNECAIHPQKTELKNKYKTSLSTKTKEGDFLQHPPANKYVFPRVRTIQRFLIISYFLQSH